LPVLRSVKTYLITKQIETMNFGEALEQVKQGKLISRSGWNGKSMFVFMRPADDIPHSVIPTIKSLPQSVKDKLAKEESTGPSVKFTAYLCMKAADGTIVNGWLASQTDMLSDDWDVVQ
jgi:hypothetical protein